MMVLRAPHRGKRFRASVKTLKGECNVKTYLKIICLVTVLAFVIGACSPAAAPPQEPAPVVDLPTIEQAAAEPVEQAAAEPVEQAAAEPPEQIVAEPPIVEVKSPSVGPTKAPPTLKTGAIANFPPLVLTASKVDQLPKIDGKADDPEWKSAPQLKLGVLTMKAVYTDEDIAFLMSWTHRMPKINSQNNWIFDAKTGNWIASDGARPQWFVMAFNMTGDVDTEGCYAFCHEDPPGSGIYHHQTGGESEYVDAWIIMAKHGYGKENHDSGWLLGVDGVSQDGDVVIDTRSTIDSNMIVAGDVTFFGYAEDSVIDSPADPKYGLRNSPRDQFCKKCHEDKNLDPKDPVSVDYTHGDLGEPGYIANWNESYSAPVYMQTEPENYADAMVLTQAEVDSGAAVRVDGLSNDQIAEYWANYEKVNGVVPQLVLQKPTGSIGDVYVAANWKDGKWTVELTRKLNTNTDDDVQFTDLNRDYPFGMSLWDHTLKVDYLTPFFREVGTLLRFQQ